MATKKKNTLEEKIIARMKKDLEQVKKDEKAGKPMPKPKEYTSRQRKSEKK